MKQRTLKKEYFFEGRGLHTGKYTRVTVGPAPAGTGVRFLRTDLAPDAFVSACAANVSGTSRSTLLSAGIASVGTVEHLLSTLTGLGIDNALVKIDGPEMPVLDGSAQQYASVLEPLEQDEERVWLELERDVFVKDHKSGSYIRIRPSEEPSFDLTIDFNSKVLGVQKVHWDPSVDYATQIAPCRTFCFFHEIRRLVMTGLIKGGDLNNAIVVVEKKVPRWQCIFMPRFFRDSFSWPVNPGYLSNGGLRFHDECGRHKMLDLIGDMRLAGGFIKARVEAYKPGHRINTMAAKKLVESLKR